MRYERIGPGATVPTRATHLLLGASTFVDRLRPRRDGLAVLRLPAPKTAVAHTIPLTGATGAVKWAAALHAGGAVETAGCTRPTSLNPSD